MVEQQRSSIIIISFCKVKLICLPVTFLCGFFFFSAAGSIIRIKKKTCRKKYEFAQVHIYVYIHAYVCVNLETMKNFWIETLLVQKAHDKQMSHFYQENHTNNDWEKEKPIILLQ